MSAFVRFVLSGAFNTVLTYGAYLVLLGSLDYRLAFSVAFAVGIAVGFVINQSYVFRTPRSWPRTVMFPMIYVGQYVAGLAIVAAAIDHWGVAREVAPLLAIGITVVPTFLLVRWLFTGHVARQRPIDRRDA